MNEEELSELLATKMGLYVGDFVNKLEDENSASEFDFDVLFNALILLCTSAILSTPNVEEGPKKAADRFCGLLKNVVVEGLKKENFARYEAAVTKESLDE